MMKFYVVPQAALSRLAVGVGFLFLWLAYGGNAPAQTALVTVNNSAAVVIAANIPVPASSGTTYVLEKYAHGRLTLNGQVTGGSDSILRTTTDTPGDTSAFFEFAATNSGYAGGLQLSRGCVQVDNPGSLGRGSIYADGSGGLPGDLLFNTDMTFTNPIVLQANTTISSGTNNVLMTGSISGTGSLAKYGSGTLTLSGASTYAGQTLVGVGTLAVGTMTLSPVKAVNILPGATLNALAPLTLNAGLATNLSIVAEGGIFQLADLTNSGVSNI